MTVNYYEKMLQEDLNVGTDVATKRNPGGGSLSGTQIGVHTFGVGQAAITQVWDPPSVPSLGETTVTVAYPGASLGDFVDVSFNLSLQNMLLQGEVTAANVVTVKLFNATQAAVDLASGTLKVLVTKSR